MHSFTFSNIQPLKTKLITDCSINWSSANVSTCRKADVLAVCWSEATSQTLHASTSMLNVDVRDSTIRKRPNKLFGKLPEESFFALKSTWQHRISLHCCIRTNCNTFGSRSFGQMVPKWRCMTIMHSTTYDEQTHLVLISAQSPHTNYEARWWRGDDLDLFCNHRTGHLAVMNMNCSVYQNMICSNVTPMCITACVILYCAAGKWLYWMSIPANFQH